MESIRQDRAELSREERGRGGVEVVPHMIVSNCDDLLFVSNDTVTFRDLLFG